MKSSKMSKGRNASKKVGTTGPKCQGVEYPSERANVKAVTDLFITTARFRYFMRKMSWCFQNVFYLSHKLKKLQIL